MTGFLILLLFGTLLAQINGLFAVDSTSQQLPSMPNVMGAKLVGIFDDDHKANEAAKAIVSSGDTKRHKANFTQWPHHINLKKRHFCDEVIFEENGVRFVPSSQPSCLLSPHHADAEHNRRKRSANSMSSWPLFFQIPAKRPDGEPGFLETVGEDSYIKVKMRACSEPGGEVLVVDLVTNDPPKVLSGFRNLGGSHQCNKWIEPVDAKSKEINDLAYEKFISESNQIRIEYKLPLTSASQTNTDVSLAEEKSEFISHKNGRKTGTRMLTYNNKDNKIIFSLEIQYEEIEFTYDDPQILPAPEPANRSEIITLKYKPNYVKTYVLGKKSRCDDAMEKNCQDKYYVGLTVQIDRLDLDFDRGDYLLVGPGSRPEFWKNTKSQMIARKIGIDKDDPQQNEANIWINADSAFVRVVTHNSLWENKIEDALQFSWTKGYTKLDDMTVDPVSQMLKEASLQVCLMEYQCPYFTTIENDIKEEAVRIFNRYLIDNEKTITTLIDQGSVQIFDAESFFYAKGHRNEQYCQFNLAIASPYDSEFPLVSADVIRKMLFGGQSSRPMVRSGVTINNCEFDRISWKTIFIPIAVILFVSISIMLVFWRMQSTMLQKNYKNKESPASLEQLHQPEQVRPYDDTAMQY